MERRLVRGVYVINFVFPLTRADRPLHVESAERRPGLAASLYGNDARPGTRQHVVAAAVDDAADTDHFDLLDLPEVEQLARMMLESLRKAQVSTPL